MIIEIVTLIIDYSDDEYNQGHVLSIILTGSWARRAGARPRQVKVQNHDDHGDLDQQHMASSFEVIINVMEDVVQQDSDDQVEMKNQVDRPTVQADQERRAVWGAQVWYGMV